MTGITCPKCKAIISETAVICPICEALRKQEEKAGEMNKDFIVGDYAISLINDVNPYQGDWFTFFIFDKDGKCVLNGEDAGHKELTQETAEQIYQMYLNYRGEIQEIRNSPDTDHPLTRLMEKYHKWSGNDI